MIGYIKGKIAVKTPTYVYIEAAGVGYHLNISLNSYSQLDGKTEALMYTHLQVREDDMSLYGFAEEEERLLFTQLISVSGIGCNIARVILSYMTVDEARRAIVNEDEFSISKVKGIGPKTAKRVIIELKDKIIKTTGLEPLKVHTGSNESTQAQSGQGKIKEEAMAALIALGFPKVGLDKHISAAFTKNSEINSVEDLIKQVLKQMN